MADTILTRIVADRVKRLESLYTSYDMSALESSLTPSQRSLAAALATPASSFILECKKASPSKGLIRPDFHPVQMAQTYARYAAAISVLTEPDYFQGDFAYLAAVSAAVSIPVLCKDFIVDPRQIILARHFGADAVLLMLSILSDEQYRELAERAAALELDVLTEVSTTEEMHRANALGAKIIGINNRNLHDLSIDPERSIEMSQLAHDQALVVAESGYHTAPQIQATAPYVDGFLVGSALSAQPNLDQACRELIYGQHKVCGLTQPQDAMVVRAAGAAFGGLIFAPKSPRAVTLEQAQAIVATEPTLDFVGVFVNRPVAEVVNYAQQLNLRAVQLHGDEDSDYITDLRQVLPSTTQIWRALGIRNAPFQLPTHAAVDAWLLDSPGGGTGEPFAWQHLTALTDEQRPHCILAGGLTQANAIEALATGIQRLDFNSGVERDRGHKDAGKIIALFAHLRHYGRSMTRGISA